MEELTYIPQPSISISQNIVTITSLAPVKFTIDGSDPIYYGLLYTGPFSINTSTVIKAVAFNENYVSEMAVGSFSPETDVVDGASGSEWTPSSGDGITIEELSAMSYATTSYVADYVTTYGGNVDLSDYTTFEDISGMGYLTSIPSEYITQDELSANSYLTSIPSEYITQDKLSANSYLTQHQDLSTYIVAPSSLTYNGQISLFPNGLQINQYGQIHAGWFNYNHLKSQNWNWMSSGSTRNLIHGILEDSSYLTSVPNTYPTYAAIENMSYITMADVSACGYITSSDIPSIPVIDENIIPKDTGTYIIGNQNKMYYRTYTSRISGDGSGLWIDTGINHRYYAGSTAFRPYTNNQYTLGTSDYRFSNTYTYNIYTNNIVVDEWGGGISTNGQWSFNLAINGANRFQVKSDSFIPATDRNRDLGDASHYWRTSYTSYLFLNGTNINDKFIPTEGGTLTGRLESNYYTTVNYEGGISSYSSVLVGADDRNSVTMLATRRLCGETSYAAAFFTNSDGRSKFTHKTKTTATTALGSNDDAFLCFNAYGFKLAYSGTPGTSATTEYEVLHTGNIGNLGYATTTDLSSYLSLSGGVMSGDIDMNGSKKGIVTSGGGQWKNGFSYAPVRVTSTATTNGGQWTPAIGIKDWGGNTWSIGTVNTRELVFSYQAVGNVDSSNTHTEWKFNSSGDLTGAGRTFIHSSNYNNYNTTYTYNLAERLNALFSFDSSTNTLTITTT